jgi:amino-acid N-acetyltransferase
MLATAMVRPAEPEDWPRIRALLSAESLPTIDLSEASVPSFIVAADAGQVVGAVAIERYGQHGLLRSLVVDPGWRGSGLGRSLAQAAESAARSVGLDSLTLLTQTTAPFFRALGYREIVRSDAPSMVGDSAEFTHLCPASCTCMTKPLDTTRSR